MDTKYRFVDEFVEDESIEIILMKTKDTVVYIFTKNTSSAIGNRHRNKMVKGIETG